MKLISIKFIALCSLFFILPHFVSPASGMESATSGPSHSSSDEFDTEERTDRLIEAAKANDTNRVNILLQAEVDINKVGPDGWSALHHAAHRGNAEMILELLNHGADINLPVNADCESGTWHFPLFLAAKNGHLGAVALLVEKGADINQENNYKDTALTRAAYYYMDPENTEAQNNNLRAVTKLLLQHGATGRLHRFQMSDNGITLILELNREVEMEKEARRQALELCIGQGANITVIPHPLIDIINSYISQ